MSDPYRIDHRPDEGGYAPWPDPGPADTGLRGGAGGVTSTLLWVLTAVFAGLNTALSVAGQDVIGGVFGGLAAVSLITLFVRYLQRRNR